MKKTGIAVLLSFLSIISYGQFTFSVSPGFGYSSVQAGYKFGEKLVPFLSYQSFGLNLFLLEETQNFDQDGKIITETYDLNASATLHVPTIGLKYLFLAKDDIKAYSTISIVKPFISGTSNNDDVDLVGEDLRAIRIWGTEVSFGMEYGFSEHFSLGGEFGLRLLSLAFEQDYDIDQYNPVTFQYETLTQHIEAASLFRATFTKISLNYYF